MKISPLPNAFRCSLFPLSLIHLCYRCIHTNWSSAEDDPETVRELIQKEVDSGWVEQFPGNLEDAQQFFGNGLGHRSPRSGT